MPELESIIGKRVVVKSLNRVGVVTAVRPRHRLPAMYQTGRQFLPAYVEVDETFWVKPNRVKVIK